MRLWIINYFKRHPRLLNVFWKVARFIISLISIIVPIKDNRIIFTSFGGRKFDDSPKAIYDYLIKDSYFQGWDIVWAFAEPEKYTIPVGRKIRIDTPIFIISLLTSHVWVSNSGMDRGIEIINNKIIRVETWHGCPLKKIGGEENTGSLLINKPTKKDYKTIRCSQSQYDRAIFARVFNADLNSILLSDLPRNDILVKGIDGRREKDIKERIGITEEKRVLLYMPTYREYSIDNDNSVYLKPPIDLKKWRDRLGKKFVLLVRAHYAVSRDMDLVYDGFAYDVSDYPVISDLYFIADAMISDYSSSFFDYSILNRPMFCFAYDYEEYNKKRGLYLELEKNLPCPIDFSEDTLLDNIDYHFYDWKSEVINFQKKYAPNAGNATKCVINAIKERLEYTK